MKPYSILNNVVFLDLKNIRIDKSISIRAIKIKNKVVTKFSTLINAKKSNNMQECKEDMKKLQDFFENLPLICHDSIVKKSLVNINNEFLDWLELIAILFPELPQFNFKYLINKFMPHYKDKDHSTEDSYLEEIIGIVNYAISRFYHENGYTLSMNFIDLEHWNWYKHVSNVNMDEVKFFLAEDEFIIELDNKEERPYPVFALKDYEKLFERKDIWQRNGKSYTSRPKQREASTFVRQGLENGKITIMEAPTGLGKSMAYLLPVAIYTHLKQEKVIISTNTKGLQNQLVEKDIPNLLEALNLGGDVNYTLIKGKSNYLCFDRFQDIEYPKDMKTLLGYVYLKRLITEKGIGDIERISDDIKERFNLKELLDKCCCDSELCDVDSCKYKEQCYYALNVENLKEAQLIVVNHALLLKWPYQSIAPLENIVVDEAHNLTKEAYDTFQSNLISYEFQKFLNDIYDSTEKSGYLYYLSKRTKKETLPIREVEIGIENCSNQINNIKLAFENYIMTSKVSREYNIKEHLNKDNPHIENIIKYLEYLKDDMSNLNIELDKAVSTLKNIANLEKDKRLKILVEKIETINKYIMLLEAVCVQSEEDYCFYFELDRNFQWWKICSIPLDVSGAFYEKVLNGVKSCLFLSATLSANNSYDNLKNTLGINIASSQNKEIVEVQPIKPIFKYKDKSAIYAIKDMNPNNVENFSKEMKEFVLELLHKVEGNIIMLFTSRKRLDAFKKEALEDINALGVRIVDGKKDIENLKSRDERCILLGSKGFFEGIDIPGDSMNTVVLDKVPNVNSKEPFYKSLIDKRSQECGEYWSAYAQVNLPIVSIDLKQIYGRLIRTEYDYGSLFIMSKFDGTNSTVKKLENQLYGVPIIRRDRHEIFKDLSLRQIRWKQINLYKIMKEIKNPLEKAISEKKHGNKIKSVKEAESFINKFMSLEYNKRNLKYDVNILLEEKSKIYISGEEINLGKNRSNIEQYFKDIL